MRRSQTIAVVLILAAAAYWLTRGSLNELAARALSILIIAAGFWATEALPLFATAFVVIGLEIVFLAGEGGLAHWLTGLLHRWGLEVVASPTVTPMTAATFLGPLASDIVVLFLGGFLLASAMTKHGVDRAVSALVLRPFTRTAWLLMVGVLGITAFFSMWMSNTATTAMMLAIVGPLVRRLEADDRFRVALVLAVPFGANIGGLGTPIGTPPNAIAYGALRGAGYSLTFLDWMLVAVPLELLLLGGTAVLLYRLYPPRGETDFGLIGYSAGLTPQGRRTAVTLLVTVTLWLTSGLHGIQPGAVALLAAAALTAQGLLSADDVDSIDWNVLILMWGGLSLAVALERSGLAAYVASVDLAALPGGPWLAALIVAAAATTLSTFMSNTATAALLVPMVLALALPRHEQLAMLAALSCSFAMAMPISTPPNAMAYATGLVSAETMLRAGAIISIASVAILLLGYRIMLPLVF